MTPKTGPDSQGRVAVGGNANFDGGGYTVARRNRAGTRQAARLVVGGNCSVARATRSAATPWIGGNATISDPTIKGSLAVAGSALDRRGRHGERQRHLWGASPGRSGSSMPGTVSAGLGRPYRSTSRAEQANLSEPLEIARARPDDTYGNGRDVPVRADSPSRGRTRRSMSSTSRGATSPRRIVSRSRRPSGATVVINVERRFGHDGKLRVHRARGQQPARPVQLLGGDEPGQQQPVDRRERPRPPGQLRLQRREHQRDDRRPIRSTGRARRTTRRSSATSRRWSPISTPSSVVPEPSSILSTLAGLGLVGLFNRLRRRGS